jgi:hypothetical protein
MKLKCRRELAAEADDDGHHQMSAFQMDSGCKIKVRYNK